VTSSHRHDAPLPPRWAGRRRVILGRVRKGTLDLSAADWRVWTGRRWRPLTGEELLAVTAHMMEAIAIGEAMQIVHGRDRGVARAREVLGYGPAPHG
jgi:photosystem II stability/assembly factor-like uncharacterized protein